MTDTRMPANGSASTATNAPVSAADSEHWARIAATAPPVYNENALPFRAVLEDVLPRGGHAFEVGCYPGRFLIYLGRHFGYTVHGIDAVHGSAVRTAEWVRAHGVAVGTIHEGDVFAFRPPRRYDVVASFGFVEHFADIEPVLARHAALVAPGGWLVVAAPNLRKLPYLMRRWLDPKGLRRHVPASMDLRRWAAILAGCGLRVVRAQYVGTAGFWVGPDPARSAFRERMAARIRRGGEAVSRHVDWPNRFTSPHMICIAHKEES